MQMYCLQIKRIWLVLKPLPGERTVETWHWGGGDMDGGHGGMGRGWIWGSERS